MYLNDDKEKAAKAAAKQAIKDAKKDLRKGLIEAPEYKKGKNIYDSTPMKNADIDYIKGKPRYSDGGFSNYGTEMKGSEYNK